MPFQKSQPQPEYEIEYSTKIRTDPIYFARHILGLPLHPGQIQWIRNSTKKINILRPGNRWGKSFVEAIIHIWHCICKPQLAGLIDSPRDWYDTTYQTLNFGPGYEQAREVLRLARDIVEGRVLIPRSLQAQWGKTNQSKLKDWAIIDDKADAQIMPQLFFYTGSKLLGRSYNDMGSAFKAKSLAFISGDECADIQELWTFTNVTLLPRLVSLRGILHFVGTVQSEGHDYMQMIELAEEDMNLPDWKNSGNFYIQKGSMYDNDFLDKREIEQTEAVADEVLRKQIIYGEYVESGNKYFGWDRVTNAIDNNLELINQGGAGRKYMVSADFAGGDSYWADFTVIMVVDYTEEPYQVVHFWRIKGGDMPIPMQYLKVEEVCNNFSGRLIIDGSALGGKNAFAFLKHLNPISLQIVPKVKADMLSTLKVAFDGGQSKLFRREKGVDIDGKTYDKNPAWGLIRYPNIPELMNELTNYKLDDKKVRNDCVMTLAQAIYWLELRRPKQKFTRMVALDFLDTGPSLPGNVKNVWGA